VVYLPIDKDAQLARIAHRQATAPHQTFPMSEADVNQLNLVGRGEATVRFGDVNGWLKGSRVTGDCAGTVFDYPAG
jgi:hypothetical protein